MRRLLGQRSPARETESCDFGVFLAARTARGHSRILAAIRLYGNGFASCQPLLTTRLIFACCLSRVPRLGCWERTSPFALEDATVFTLPTEQNAVLIAVLAAERVLPTKLGTTHGRRTNIDLTVRLSFVVTLQRCLPLQAPEQPANFEPLAAFD